MVKGQLPLQKMDCFCRKRHKKAFQVLLATLKGFLKFQSIIICQT